MFYVSCFITPMNKLPFFQKGSSGGLSFNKKNKYNPRVFLFVYSLLVILLFAILVLRLFQLTIVKGDYYRRLSETNRIRELLIEPRRGTIIDRKGFLIAQNLLADIKKIEPRITSARVYQSPEAIAPFIGYRQTADQAAMKNDPCINKLHLGDKVGKKGVEEVFDCDLRGRPGKKLVEVDAAGKYTKTLTVIPPEDGKTIHLGLDFELQKKAYDLIKDKKGAVIALKPKTGEVMILASSPSFNPQDFEDQKTSEISRFLTDKNKPLFNRTTEATYPPGSLFKLVLATGALEDKKIDEKFQFEDIGTIKAGEATFGNWYFLQYGKTEGMVDIVKAIRRSTDTFFYKIGEMLGVDEIKRWAQILGYGKKTGISFDEAEGLIPSPFWKEEALNDRWYLGDTYNLSIGQGYLLVTPLQVTQTTAVFANGGFLCKPELLKYGQGSALSLQQTNCKKLPISPKNLNLIREGMKEACSTGGTGWPLFDFKARIPTSEVKGRLGEGKTSEVKIQTACKTGTAESSQIKSGVPHAWITLFAPYENPEIVLTVLIEEGGQGSDVAGPIAKEILKTYFERNQ